VYYIGVRTVYAEGKKSTQKKREPCIHERTLCFCKRALGHSVWVCVAAQVYANADTPEDAAEARRNGATGIGLVRTEHMFYSSEERLTAVCVAVCCSVLQFVAAVCTKHMFHSSDERLTSVHLTAVCLAVSCSELQQCFAMRNEQLFYLSDECLAGVCVAVYCSSVFRQCAAAVCCSSALQCVLSTCVYSSEKRLTAVCVAVYCMCCSSVLQQCVAAVCCSAWQAHVSLIWWSPHIGTPHSGMCASELQCIAAVCCSAYRTHV